MASSLGFYDIKRKNILEKIIQSNEDQKLQQYYTSSIIKHILRLNQNLTKQFKQQNEKLANMEPEDQQININPSRARKNFDKLIKKLEKFYKNLIDNAPENKKTTRSEYIEIIQENEKLLAIKNEELEKVIQELNRIKVSIKEKYDQEELEEKKQEMDPTSEKFMKTFIGKIKNLSLEEKKYYMDQMNLKKFNYNYMSKKPFPIYEILFTNDHRFIFVCNKISRL